MAWQVRRRLFLRGLRIWHRINEPRFVSIAHFTVYVALLLAGVYSLRNPPGSLQGEIGASAMSLLLWVATASALVGSIAVLPGKYWLERFAVIGLTGAATIYLLIVLVLHATTDGNRLWQAGIIYGFIVSNVVRFYRIKDRPFRPAPAARA